MCMDLGFLKFEVVKKEFYEEAVDIFFKKFLFFCMLIIIRGDKTIFHTDFHCYGIKKVRIIVQFDFIKKLWIIL